MSQYWDAVAARSDQQHASDELEAAAYRLAMEQVLYYSDRASRTAYHMIERFEREFRQALAPLGIDVQVNRQLRYAFAQPRHAKVGVASVGQTTLALVLRVLYDESASAGLVTEDGEVACNLIDLSEKHRLLTGRDLPLKGRLDALLESMKRWGIARKSADPDVMTNEDSGSVDQPYVVMIRPAIVDILSETALARLAIFKAADAIEPGAHRVGRAAGDDTSAGGNKREGEAS